jgi:hypothetical protein
LALILLTFGEAHILVKYVVDQVPMEAPPGKVPDIHQVVIFNGSRNEDQKVSVLMVFLELKGCCSIEMERVAESDLQKCCFLTNQLI